MWIKICGLSRTEDVIQCATAGVSALGFLLARSPVKSRNLDQLLLEEAALLVQRCKSIVESVVLTHATEIDELQNICRVACPDTLQLQGDIAPASLVSLSTRFPNIRLIKKIGVHRLSTGDMLFKEIETFNTSGGIGFFVLDSARSDGGRGGTGNIHDWSLSASAVLAFPRCKFILAGGLTPDNIVDAIRIVRPHGADVMSGVSSARGIKDLDLVRSFVRRARGAIPD